jgi:hypothetical protein
MVGGEEAVNGQVAVSLYLGDRVGPVCRWAGEGPSSCHVLFRWAGILVVVVVVVAVRCWIRRIYIPYTLSALVWRLRWERWVLYNLCYFIFVSRLKHVCNIRFIHICSASLLVDSVARYITAKQKCITENVTAFVILPNHTSQSSPPHQ